MALQGVILALSVLIVRRLVVGSAREDRGAVITVVTLGEGATAQVAAKALGGTSSPLAQPRMKGQTTEKGES